MIQIPLPRMVGDQTLMIASQTVEHPVCCGHVGVIVRTVDSFRSLLIPACPGFPIEVTVVVVWRHLVGLVIEETLAYAILVRSVLRLQATPEHAVDELLKLVELFFV